MSIKYRQICDIPDSLINNFTVCYMGKEVYFQVFESPSRFIKLYSIIPKYSRHFYEVIRKDKRKFILDIDVNVSEKYIIDLAHYLEYYMGTIAIFTSCSETKTSYHLVAVDSEYTIDQCKNIVNKLDPYNELCDRSVYKINQLFRIEGSTKYGEKRYKRLLNSQKDLSDNITDYFAYTHSRVDICKVKKRQNIHNLNLPIPKEYIIRKYVSDTLISLKRVSSGTCIQCNRVHDSENAYLFYSNNQWNFRCFRSF